MSIHKQSSGHYKVYWRESAGGAQKTRTFNRKVDAVNFETTTKAGLLDGTYVRPKDGQTTFEDYAVA